MNTDPELDEWRSEWMAQAVGSEKRPAGMRADAVRQQRRLRAAHVLELLAALIFLSLSAAIVWRNRDFEAWLWAGIVWATTLAATAFSVWNWHILWTANVKSVAEYTLDYRKRCLARLRAARFGQRLLVVQIAIAVPWLSWDYLGHRLPAVVFFWAVAVLACLALGFWALFTHHRRTALRELEELGASQLIARE